MWKKALQSVDGISNFKKKKKKKEKHTGTGLGKLCLERVQWLAIPTNLTNKALGLAEIAREHVRCHFLVQPGHEIDQGALVQFDELLHRIVHWVKCGNEWHVFLQSAIFFYFIKKKKRVSFSESLLFRLVGVASENKGLQMAKLLAQGLHRSELGRRIVQGRVDGVNVVHGLLVQ